MRLSFSFALSVVLLSGVIAAAQQQPSLGDVVRQDKPKKKAARVITDDDMPARAPEASPSGEVGRGNADNKPADASDEKAAKDSKQRKLDPGEVNALKQRLGEIDSDEKNLTSHIGELEKAASNEDDPVRRQGILHMLERGRASLERERNERSDINKKLEEQKKTRQ